MASVMQPCACPRRCRDLRRHRKGARRSPPRAPFRQGIHFSIFSALNQQLARSTKAVRTLYPSSTLESSEPPRCRRPGRSMRLTLSTSICTGLYEMTIPRPVSILDSHCCTVAEEASTRKVSSVSARALSVVCACARVIRNRIGTNTHSILRHVHLYSM